MSSYARLFSAACGVATALALTAAISFAQEMKPYKEKVGKWHEFVPIPGGKFTMGSPAGEAGRKDDEGPAFEVAVEPFWMGKYEVTWDDFELFRQEYEPAKQAPPVPADKFADAVCIPTPLWEQDSQPILKAMGQYGGYPVADISHFAAKQYCKWLSKKTGHFYRLPTEAEWEYAARAGTKTAYFFGNDPAKLEEYAYFFDNAKWDNPEKGFPGANAGYRTVGSLKANPWGLHDIYGNVAEWVIDGYTKDHYAKFSGKSVAGGEAIHWPTEIFPTVVRGGHWDAAAEDCRSATRLPSHKDWQKKDPQLPKSVWWYTDAFHVGFRIVRPLKEPEEKEKLKYWEAHSEDITNVLEANQKEVRGLIKP